jgi:hypothetical protein
MAVLDRLLRFRLSVAQSICPPAYGRYLFPACSGRLLGLGAMEEPNSFLVPASLFSVRKRRYHVINLVGNRYEAFM